MGDNKPNAESTAPEGAVDSDVPEFRDAYADQVTREGRLTGNGNPNASANQRWLLEFHRKFGGRLV